MPALLSLECEPFSKVLESELHEAEQRFLRIKSCEPLYEILHGVLKDARLCNDVSLKRPQSYSESHKSLTAHIHALPGNYMIEFDAVVAEIGKRLVAAGYHDNGIPAVNDKYSTCPWKEFKWKVWDKNSCSLTTIYLYIHLPDNGIMDVDVRKDDIKTTTRMYRLVHRDLDRR